MKMFYRRQVWRQEEYIPCDFAKLIAKSRQPCVAMASIRYTPKIADIADEMGVVATENWNGSYHESHTYPMAFVASRRFSTARRKMKAFLARIEGIRGDDSSVQRLNARRFVRPGD